ncbi:putative phage abortive infection protein [Chryseobacterium paludis]|uniref:putative phage abortive infection protein n=1 Tax=Chryseobacterium paludis TaxID=2956784 RepID=UPI0021C06B25|nr:putative phage abortive infection protein [Chryseobacterium paludis]
MRQNKQDTDQELDLKYLAIIVGSIIVVLWLISLGVLGIWVTKGNEIGDSFGAVNALFSGLALAGIILTILMQREELKLQRRELVLTRKEMEHTRDEFVTQNETLRIQRFENTFFQMTSLLSSILANIEIDWERYGIIKSRKALNKLAYTLSGYLVEEMHTDEFMERILQFDLSSLDEAVTEKDLILVYDRLYQNNKDILGHYFRTLYHIIKLVHETDGVDRKRYISIIRAQLSNSEQILLFYNCLHENGKEKFKPLIEIYSLLHNIDLSFLPNMELKTVYAESAYNTTAP